MPELPEVQTIVDDLNKKIKGDTIVDFWSDWKKTIKDLSFAKFKKEIVGKKIIKAWRIGKTIFIDLSGGKTIYIHLKMTGHLLVKSKACPERSRGVESMSRAKSRDRKPALSEVEGSKANNKNYFDERVNQYIHHIWYLKSGKTLGFSDMRKFGKIMLVDTDKFATLKEMKNLGIDALDKGFTEKKLGEILIKNKNKKIRDLLMDQGKIAGIGNIYASEILFEAKILPTKPAGKIKPEERKNLYRAIKKILKKATKMRGTSDSDYRDTAGAPGNFQKVLRVYRREGELCKICKSKIKRLKMGGRSAFYCGKCQE